MAGNINVPHTFAADTGPEALSLLDTCYSALAAVLNTLSTYSNYYVDSGAVNALAVATIGVQTVSLSDGLLLEVKVANTSTTAAPTLTVNALGAQTIIDNQGNPLVAGALVAGGRYFFIYDLANTAFRVLNPSAATAPGVGTGLASVNAANIGVGETYTVWRSTARAITSNAVSAIDPVLQFTNLPVGSYSYEVFAPFTAGAIGIGVRCGLLNASGTMTGSIMSFITGASSSALTPAYNGGLVATATSYGAGPDLYMGVEFEGQVIVTVAGTLGFYWAQGNSNAAAMSLDPGASFSISRLG